MAEATTFLKGQLQDHLGQVLHPDTEGDQVQLNNGKNLETQLQDLLNKFDGYLSKASGGIVNGNIETRNGHICADQWLAISSGSDGHVLWAQNAYKDHWNNTYHYLRTHESMGAKGLIFRHGSSGIYWFDTGMGPTTADEEFTPTFKRLDRPEAELISGTDLNNLTENGVYCGENFANSPNGSTDWYYINVLHLANNTTYYVTQVARGVNDFSIYARTRINGTWGGWQQIITGSGGNVSGALTLTGNGGNGLQLVGSDHVYIPIYKSGVAGGRSGYIGYPDKDALTLAFANELPNGTISLNAPGGVYVNARKLPNYYAATWAPLSTDGQDGDVWDVYV